MTISLLQFWFCADLLYAERNMAASISSSLLKFLQNFHVKDLHFAGQTYLPLVKTTDSKAFNLMVTKLDPAETT